MKKLLTIAVFTFLFTGHLFSNETAEEELALWKNFNYGDSPQVVLDKIKNMESVYEGKTFTGLTVNLNKNKMQRKKNAFRNTAGLQIDGHCFINNDFSGKLRTPKKSQTYIAGIPMKVHWCFDKLNTKKKVDPTSKLKYITMELGARNFIEKRLKDSLSEPVTAADAFGPMAKANFLKTVKKEDGRYWNCDGNRIGSQEFVIGSKFFRKSDSTYIASFKSKESTAGGPFYLKEYVTYFSKKDAVKARENRCVYIPSIVNDL
jgi:hypothetical protein